MSEKKLIDFFNESEYYSLKYKNYFPVYERLFEKYRNREITFVEIGVLSGGSLRMWKKYFGAGCKVIGVDLNPKAKEFEEDGIEIFIGSQSDKNFWENFFNKVGKVDIILDDGGHTNFQQIMTTCCTVPNINDNGLLVVEDVFHSYGVSYATRGFYNPSKYSFMNFCKKIADDINSRFPEIKKFNFSLNKYIYSMEIFESIVAFKIDRNLSNIKNEVIYNKGQNFELKDYAHIHDPSIQGSNKFVVFIKKLYPKFRGTLKYLVFKMNERLLKKFFK